MIAIGREKVNIFRVTVSDQAEVIVFAQNECDALYRAFNKVNDELMGNMVIENNEFEIFKILVKRVELITTVEMHKELALL